uniref:Myelin protein zero like 3 n=1 Tax=Ornithorhynchus anatinus TaxID=9258 RepID=A0A6I8NE07_ORNAN
PRGGVRQGPRPKPVSDASRVSGHPRGCSRGSRELGLARLPARFRLPLLTPLHLFRSGVSTVLPLEIKADTQVRGYVGERVKLKCTFKSSSAVTDKLTIDWTYRPPSSSRTETIFHYQSFQYPTTAGTFRDRISWVGDVYRGDASISISHPTMKDNGTFSCTVKNPPDVHHNVPMTELVITERGFVTKLSSTALLSIMVFIPSAIVVTLLLVRMGRKSAGLKKRSKSGYKKSSIEVSDDTDQEEEEDCVGKLCIRCAECLDSDSDEAY